MRPALDEPVALQPADQASPGYVATDLNGHRCRLQVGDDESVAAVIALATLPGDGPTGEFHAAEGRLPW